MRCDLQIFSGCVCPLEQLHAQSPFLFPIVFSINNNYEQALGGQLKGGWGLGAGGWGLGAGGWGLGAGVSAPLILHRLSVLQLKSELTTDHLTVVSLLSRMSVKL